MWFYHLVANKVFYENYIMSFANIFLITLSKEQGKARNKFLMIIKNQQNLYFSQKDSQNIIQT